MALFGNLPSVRAQLARVEHFAAGLAYIEEAARPGTKANGDLLALTVGKSERVDLPGGAFALPQAYFTKARSDGRWETHRAYIDIQAVVVGEEFMEVADRGRL